MVEHFGGSAVHYPPGAFGQNNLNIAERIIEHVRGELPAGSRVAEFYAGVGAIGLSVLERVSELRLNELSPHSLHGLSLGLGELAQAERAKISIQVGAAGEARDMATGVDVVIADPPRKGLDPQLTTALSEEPPARFVYVSCGLDSFLSDSEQLARSRQAAPERADRLQPDPDSRTTSRPWRASSASDSSDSSDRVRHSNEQTYSAMPAATLMSKPDLPGHLEEGTAAVARAIRRCRPAARGRRRPRCPCARARPSRSETHPGRSGPAFSWLPSPRRMVWLTTFPSKYTLALATAVTFLNSRC